MGDCIRWEGCHCSGGYGSRKVKGKVVGVHRLEWEAHNGPIPEGMCVLHTCDVPDCHNIEHLFLGTHKDNTQDMLAKNRQRKPTFNWIKGTRRNP